MNLESQLSKLEEQTRGLEPPDRARLCCQLAKQLEKAGEYAAAREALNEFWPGTDGSLNIETLDESSRAEIQLRIGALAGWLGSADQSGGGQETAKDLITRSLQIFESLGQTTQIAEARGDLALCYWREGSYDEARIHLVEALDCLGDKNDELKAVLLIRAGIVEVWAQRLSEALCLYNEASRLLDESEDHALKGAFHNEFALLFNRLAPAEGREDYLDRALIEYAAASFHFEQAGNKRYLARVENNLGYLFFTIGRYKEAHSHLNRARHLFLELGDIGTGAQVDDTRARTLLAEGKIHEAEKYAQSAGEDAGKGRRAGVAG